MCPGATMDYLASALLPALSFNNPTTLSSHQLITWHFFFGAVPFSQTSSLLTWALKRGLCLAVSFKPQADCVDWDWKWPLLCFGGWKLKCRVAVLEASRAFFPPERKRNLACQSWQFLSSFAVRTKLSLWVGLPSCAFRKTEETNLSVLLAMNPKSRCVNHRPR